MLTDTQLNIERKVFHKLKIILLKYSESQVSIDVLLLWKSDNQSLFGELKKEYTYFRGSFHLYVPNKLSFKFFHNFLISIES